MDCEIGKEPKKEKQKISNIWGMASQRLEFADNAIYRGFIRDGRNVPRTWKIAALFRVTNSFPTENYTSSGNYFSGIFINLARSLYRDEDNDVLAGNDLTRGN